MDADVNFKEQSSLEQPIQMGQIEETEGKKANATTAKHRNSSKLMAITQDCKNIMEIFIRASTETRTSTAIVTSSSRHSTS
jgi:hypothetical protein